MASSFPLDLQNTTTAQVGRRLEAHGAARRRLHRDFDIQEEPLLGASSRYVGRRRWSGPSSSTSRRRRANSARDGRRRWPPRGCRVADHGRGRAGPRQPGQQHPPGLRSGVRSRPRGTPAVAVLSHLSARPSDHRPVPVRVDALLEKGSWSTPGRKPASTIRRLTTGSPPSSVTSELGERLQGPASCGERFAACDAVMTLVRGFFVVHAC